MEYSRASSEAPLHHYDVYTYIRLAAVISTNPKLHKPTHCAYAVHEINGFTIGSIQIKDKTRDLVIMLEPATIICPKLCCPAYKPQLYVNTCSSVP